MLEKYKIDQPNFYNYFLNAISNNKLSHAYLIETNGIKNSQELAIDLAKFLFCNNEYNEKIVDLIDKNNFPDLFIVDSSKEIKKEQILELQRIFSTKPVNTDKLIYIINDASMLNSSSANTLLKFLEEPEDGIIAILLTNNTADVIETITSRCQIISLINKDNFNNIFNNISPDEIDNIYQDIIDYVTMFEEKKKNFIGSNTSYKYNDNLKVLLDIMLNIYLDIFRIKTNRNSKCIDKYNSLKLKEIMKNIEINDIINKINVVNKFNNILKYNVNKELFVDNLLITLMGGKND